MILDYYLEQLPDHLIHRLERVLGRLRGPALWVTLMEIFLLGMLVTILLALTVGIAYMFPTLAAVGLFGEVWISRLANRRS